MKKLIICAAALSGFAMQAAAADLGDIASMKDPIPDKLSYAGVTIYGTVDVGYSYQTNGAPQSAYFYTGGLDWNMAGSKQNREAVSALTGNALEQSKVGVKIEEQLGYGFAAIGKIETNFNPWSGELADACKSLTENNGKATSTWTSGLDGSRCGQAFSGQAYGGISSSMYGTLTIGRQSSLQNDTVGTYDPMGGSYALSLIGYSGGADGGIGSTETARWDNSLKYLFSYGPLHAAFMYADGSNDSSILNEAYGANAGFKYKGLSVDAVYTRENGAIGTAAIGTDSKKLDTIGTCSITGGAGQNACPTGDVLNGTITNNEFWSIQGKYTFELGGLGLKDGGYKDEAPAAKLTFYGGYVYTDMSHFDGNIPVGSFNSGGYQLLTLISPIAAGSDKILETSFAGAKYETGPGL